MASEPLLPLRHGHLLTRQADGYRDSDVAHLFKIDREPSALGAPAQPVEHDAGSCFEGRDARLLIGPVFYDNTIDFADLVLIRIKKLFVE
jgi:hypothetical protein